MIVYLVVLIEHSTEAVELICLYDNIEEAEARSDKDWRYHVIEIEVGVDIDEYKNTIIDGLRKL